ncbi:MAG: H-type lectin domain-containing protein [Ignavibacteriales bacterium]|nr:H-type lectin domain-containing protein [Ignavibacteriales bacterium]
MPHIRLIQNDGERSMTIDIDFETPFKEKPQIFLSVAQIDADKESNLRYNVEAISISRDGFTIKSSHLVRLKIIFNQRLLGGIRIVNIKLFFVCNFRSRKLLHPIFILELKKFL